MSPAKKNHDDEDEIDSLITPIGKVELRHVVAILGIVLLLGQLGVMTWAKWSLERTIAEAVSKGIVEHDKDPTAHPNMIGLVRMEQKLDIVGSKQTEMLQKLSEIQAIQMQQEGRMNRIQKVGAR